MSTWHSLSGYLQYKCSNNALGRLMMKKKVWCVLEECQCQLHYYRNEEDVRRHKSSQGHIDLHRAAISLDLEHQNQFIVLSDNKEHIFTAENHESMMIWLLGLQAKRDLHSRKVNNVSKDSSGSTEMAKHPVPSDFDLWSCRPSMFMTCSQQQLSPGSHQPQPGSLLRHQRGSTGHRPRTELHKLGDSVDSGISIYKKKLEASRSYPQHSSSERHLAHMKTISTSHSGLGQDNTSDSDDVFGLESPGHKHKRASKNWLKLQSMVMTHMLHGNKLQPEPVTRETRKDRSISSRSASSDSAIEKGEGTPQELSTRLTELERELISTKCELAKVMNKQTCYQELLHQKDDTIKLLGGNLATGCHGNELKLDDKKIRSPQKEKEFQEKIRVLQNQNRFLNEEVKKLAKIRLQEHGKFQEQNSKLQSLEAEIEKWKMDYVSLIQSSIRHPGEEGYEDLELCLYGGDKHKKRVQVLLDEARKVNPRLPTYESLANNEVHVDAYGFKHVYTNTGLLLHYLCTELTYHYLVQAGVYEEHQRRWTLFMRQHGKAPMQSVIELKQLCRGGIPDRFRKQMWRHLVHHRVRDIIKEKGEHYYRNLCNLLPESPLAACYRKQISLDLMRTIPSNVKFSSPGSKGIMDLQDVLLAFCIHNPTIGYCQGMNFIVGMALIFLDAEDAFWTLIAVAERYFNNHYFDHSLIGAQADQQVLQDLVREKLPALCRHLENIDIELSTITLNWFLAVFFDAVPFQTLLRVWDCFLLEGPKVLFRFSLAILRLHERDILQKTDTMGIMKHLKACAKLTYDVEGLVKLAFDGFRPFPKRSDIQSKQTCYLNALKEKHKKKELQRLAFAEREQLYMSMEAEAGFFMGIESAVALPNGKVWFCYGDQHVGKVCEVSPDTGTMSPLNFQMDSRLMCMCPMSEHSVILGTISWMLLAIEIANQHQEWQIQLHDAILAVCCYDDEESQLTRIFAGLAEGTVAVTEKLFTKKEPNVDVIYIPIGQAPVTCLMLLDDQLWCASGNTVAVIQVKTLDAMDTFSVSVNPYDHILSLLPSDNGIWISLRGSSILELWDPKSLNCRMLYDTRTDRYPQLRKEDDAYFNRARITSTLVFDNHVWVGTGEGNLIIYELQESAQLKTPTDHSPSVETTSSVLVRPTKPHELSGKEVVARMQAKYNMNGSHDNQQPFHSTNYVVDDDSTQDGDDESETTDRVNLHLHHKRRSSKAAERRLLRRRSSSENDMSMLDSYRYANDGLATLDLEVGGPMKTQLEVDTRLFKRNASENDIKQLKETRDGSDGRGSLNSSLAENMEQQLEEDARRQSVSMVLQSEEDARRQSVSMVLQSEEVAIMNLARRSSCDSRSGAEISCDAASHKSSVIPQHQKLIDGYKSSDDRRTLSSCLSMCSTRSLVGSISSARNRYLESVGTEEDVFETDAENVQKTDEPVCNGEAEVNGEIDQDEKGTDSDKVEPAVVEKIFMEEKMEDEARRMSVTVLGDTFDDDSYISSSLSVTPITPMRENDPEAKKLFLSVKSVGDNDIDHCVDKEDVNRRGSGGLMVEKVEGKLTTSRRSSVIDDITQLCHDCKLSPQKCEDCSDILKSQELLKLTEQRKLLVDQLHDEMSGLKEISKANGLKTVADEASYTSVNKNKRNLSSCCLVKVDGVDKSVDHKEVNANNTGNRSLDERQEECTESVRVFPASCKQKGDLSRTEKVGYWLSSMSKTSSFSNEDVYTIGETEVANGNLLNGSFDKIDSEEDVFVRSDDRMNGCPERPSSLNLPLAKGKGRLHGNPRLLGQESVKQDGRRLGSSESDGRSSGKTRRSSSASSGVAVNKNDPGVQYRLDFSGVHIETDVESDMERAVGELSVHNLAMHGNGDSRKNSLDIGSIQENFSKLDTVVPLNSKVKGQVETTVESEGKQTERQKLFEFLKTPSLASRHMSLGLKIIEDDIDWMNLYGNQVTTPSPTSSIDQRMADFLRTPSMGSMISSAPQWSSYENISTPSQNDPRLLLMPSQSGKGHLSHSASTASFASDNDIIFNMDLSLEAKVKISDKPVKCLLSTSCNDKPIIMSFSGSYGDDEAVLKWSKHQNEQLWTNEPILELCPRTKMAILPMYMRRRMSSTSSFASQESQGKR